VIETLAPILPILAAGWLANKVALGGLALLVFAKDLKLAIIAVKAMTTAQWFWNASIIANPIGIILTAIIVVLTLVVAAIVLVVKNWDFLVGKMREGIFKIVSLFTTLLAPVIRLFLQAQGALAGFFGFDKAAETMKNLEKDFDAFQFRLREKAGIKFRINPEIFGQLDLLTEFLNVTEKKVQTPLAFPQSLFPSPVNFTGSGRRQTRETPVERGGLGGGFQIPGLETVSKQIVEHVMKLKVDGLPAGPTVSVDTGGEAPPIEVSVLGEQ